MKAIIDGVTIEGTPEEIAKFVELVGKKNEEAPKTTPVVPCKPYAPTWPGTNPTYPWTGPYVTWSGMLYV